MDTKEIKRQIVYWEAVLKDNKMQVKVLEAQGKTIENTLKALRTLVGKDETKEVDSQTVEEQS